MKLHTHAQQNVAMQGKEEQEPMVLTRWAFPLSPNSLLASVHVTIKSTVVLAASKEFHCVDSRYLPQSRPPLCTLMKL